MQKDKATLMQEEKRKANQARLAKLQAEIARERYLKLKRGIVDNPTPKPTPHKITTLQDYTAYHTSSEFPKEAEKDKVCRRLLLFLLLLLPLSTLFFPHTLFVSFTDIFPYF
jgi:hypothetical protein